MHDAHAVLFLMERPTDWTQLREATGDHAILLAGDTEATLEGAADEDFDSAGLSAAELASFLDGVLGHGVHDGRMELAADPQSGRQADALHDAQRDHQLGRRGKLSAE